MMGTNEEKLMNLVTMPEALEKLLRLLAAPSAIQSSLMDATRILQHGSSLNHVLEDINQMRAAVEPFAELQRAGDGLSALTQSASLLVQRLNELSTKSKEAMVLASSKGWFFGWHDYLDELMARVEEVAVLEQPCIDEFMRQYYRSKLQLLTDELAERHPNRASVIKAAVRAHSMFGADGYFLSIPVFIAQADGLLTEIAGVKSALARAPKEKGELQALKALREKLATDQESLNLVHPILILNDLDFLKSAGEREQPSGESFTALNRHQIVHGESWDYGTEINSLKAFSFLAFVGLHLPMILETTDQGPIGTEPKAERRVYGDD
jgi:hypothetical protein